MVDFDAAMQAYYALDKERDRLAEGTGRVEFLRTCELVSRALPEPPAVIADIGGGPGRYTDWLAERGYRVVHRDPVAHHVDQVRSRHDGNGVGADRGAHPSIDTALGDARDLDLAFPSVLDLVDEAERTGTLEPVAEGGFNGYTHTPAELRQELADAGLRVDSLVSVEGISFALGDLDHYLAGEDSRSLLLDMLRAVEAVPELLGVGPHLLASCSA